VDKGLLERLASINGTLTTQWNRLQNIRSTVDQSGAQADKARTRVQHAEELIDRARTQLDKARSDIANVVGGGGTGPVWWRWWHIWSSRVLPVMDSSNPWWDIWAAVENMINLN
jgi:hypothetical protein